MAATAISKTRRAQIVEAAHELYEIKGIDQTSVKDIAERAGITRSLFYHYFESKDDVTNAILEGYIESFVECAHQWNDANEGRSLREAIEAAVTMIRTNILDPDPFRRDLLKPQNAELFQEFTQRTADTLARYLTETTTVIYARYYEVKIKHTYETFYVLFVGLFGYLHNNPDASDELIFDIIADVLHLEI